TVYARWIARPPELYIEPPLIPVTFNVQENGGTWWSPNINDNDIVLWIRQGSTFWSSALVNMPQFPIKDGYIFMGWYDTPQGPPNPAVPDFERFHSNIIINAARTVYAHFMPYNIVTFDPNGGIFTGTNLRAVAQGRTINQMNHIWNTGQNNTGMPTSGTLIPPQSLVPLGHPAAVYGWNFYGWATWSNDIRWRISRTQHDWVGATNFNTEPNMTGSIFNQNTVVTNDITVYAPWQVTFIFYINTLGAINAATTNRSVPLHFSANTNQFHPNTGTNQIFFPNTNAGDTNRFWNQLLLYALERPATLVGWNTAQDGSGYWIDESTIITTMRNGEPFITGTTRLYAQWGNLITFLPNGAPPESGIPITGILRVAGDGVTLGTAEAPFDPSIYGLPDQHHIPGDTSNPLWNPYWGLSQGITFGGWNLMPDRTGPAQGEASPAYQPLTIFAIWLVDIVYDPTGGRMQAEGPPQYTPHEAATPIGSPFGAARQPREMERNGWTFVHWNEERWGLHAGTPAFSPTATIDRSYTLYAQWSADVTFNLQGGYIDFNPANVIRTVPEGPVTTIVNWPLGPGMPPNPMRPGYTFVQWYTRGNLVDGVYERIPFNGNTNIGARGNTTVFAQWENVYLDMFEFIKTDNQVYENPYYIVPVNGAVFRLYRQTGVNQWTFVTQRTSSTTADGDGWVRFDDAITLSGRYRLIESQAPRGYTPPPGYWIIEWNRVDPWVDTTWELVMPPLPQGYVQQPFFVERFNDDVDDYVWHVGNRTTYVEFSFIKTDHYLRPLTDYIINPLPGAQFLFYLFTPRSNSGLHSNEVTAAGITARYWTLVYTTISGADGSVSAPLWQGGNIFHMVENAPPGFDDPIGQWRITLGVDGNSIVYIHPTIEVFPVAARGYTPEFRLLNIPVNQEGDYDDILHLYNLPESRPFEFIKVDDALLRDPGNPAFDPVDHPLDGAVFRLYRERSALQGGGWEFVGTYTSGNSGVPGLVRFNIWMIGNYRLVEYTAPDGFVLQMGHWLIDWNRPDLADPSTWYMVTSHHGGNQAFATRPIPDSENVPQNTRVLGNERKPSFPVHKTDYRMYAELAGNGDWNMINTFLLPGAGFTLVRYNNLESGNTPADVLVAPDMIGDAEGEWTVVWSGTSTNNITTPMNMLLDSRFRYFQLIETSVPSGFQLPGGQWRIVLAANTTANPGGGVEWHLVQTPFRSHWVSISHIGGVPIPAIFRNPSNGVFYLGNWRQLNMPMAGGSGSTMFIVSGMVLVTMALALMVYFYLYKNGVIPTKLLVKAYVRRITKRN
ncbi:MAG: SpaA isopeptide-forming pilin-related protein, partial [Defluviitaleaceae bacterium]|nr:SpaA isopeptide-forming pilin-related protein [Defluviitaleaceae bacterium]